PALGGRETLPIAVDLDHVGVAGEAPEAGAVGFFLPPDRLVGPEVVEHLERDAVHVVVTVVEVDLHRTRSTLSAAVLANQARASRGRRADPPWRRGAS